MKVFDNRSPGEPMYFGPAQSAILLSIGIAVGYFGCWIDSANRHIYTNRTVSNDAAFIVPGHWPTPAAGDGTPTTPPGERSPPAAEKSTDDVDGRQGAAAWLAWLNRPAEFWLWLAALAAVAFWSLIELLDLDLHRSSAPVGWKCFHCGEAFSDRKAAALHFGTSELQQPACCIDVAEYRRMEEINRRHCDEDTELHREICRLHAEISVKEQRAEEAGYAKGLKDYTALESRLAEQLQKETSE